jgi:hypothetical protein
MKLLLYCWIIGTLGAVGAVPLAFIIDPLAGDRITPFRLDACTMLCLAGLFVIFSSLPLIEEWRSRRRGTVRHGNALVGFLALTSGLIGSVLVVTALHVFEYERRNASVPRSLLLTAVFLIPLTTVVSWILLVGAGLVGSHRRRRQHLAHQKRATQALIKFCTEHHCDSRWIATLQKCLKSLQRRSIGDALRHYDEIANERTSRLPNWRPAPAFSHENDEYVQGVFQALVANWARVMTLSYEPGDTPDPH